MDIDSDLLIKPTRLPSGRIVAVTSDRFIDKQSKTSTLVKKAFRPIRPEESLDLVEWFETDPRVSFRYITPEDLITDSELRGSLRSSWDNPLIAHAPILTPLIDADNCDDNTNNAQEEKRFTSGQYDHAEAYRHYHDALIRFLKVRPDQKIPIRLHLEPIRYYSKLVEQLAKCATNAAPVSQWLGILNNLKGISADELKWCDISNWLRQQGPAKRLLQETILEQSTFRYVTPKLYRTIGINPSHQCVFRRSSQVLPKRFVRKYGLDHAQVSVAFEHPAFNYRILDIQFSDLLGQHQAWMSVDDKWDLLVSPKRCLSRRVTDGMRLIEYALQNRFPDRVVYSDQAKWQKYTLDGKAHHQEWLLLLEDFPANFIDNAHYDVRNVLIHIRTSERYDRYGQRFLLIEELQSDWLQKRDEGQHLYLSGMGKYELMPWAKHWYELGLNLGIQLAVDQGYDGIAITTGEQQSLRYGSYFKASGVRFYDRILRGSLGKLAKEWDCESTIYQLPITHDNCAIVESKDTYEVIRPTGSKIASGLKDLKSAEGVRARLSNLGYALSPGILLSDPLREHVMKKGVPMFGRLVK